MDTGCVGRLELATRGVLYLQLFCEAAARLLRGCMEMGSRTKGALLQYRLFGTVAVSVMLRGVFLHHRGSRFLTIKAAAVHSRPLFT